VILTGYVVVKFTKHQVEIFLKHFKGFTGEWLEESPKGQEGRDVKTLERFFKRLKNSIF